MGATDHHRRACRVHVVVCSGAAVHGAPWIDPVMSRVNRLLVHIECSLVRVAIIIYEVTALTLSLQVWVAIALTLVLGFQGNQRLKLTFFSKRLAFGHHSLKLYHILVNNRDLRLNRSHRGDHFLTCIVCKLSFIVYRDVAFGSLLVVSHISLVLRVFKGFMTLLRGVGLLRFLDKASRFERQRLQHGVIVKSPSRGHSRKVVSNKPALLCHCHLLTRIVSLWLMVDLFLPNVLDWNCVLCVEVKVVVRLDSSVPANYRNLRGAHLLLCHILLSCEKSHTAHLLLQVGLRDNFEECPIFHAATVAPTPLSCSMKRAIFVLRAILDVGSDSFSSPDL